MIRFGPAAAPRWFDCRIDRLPAYLDLIHGAGSGQIEFVLLPGPGNDELGRVHLLEPQWSDAVQLCSDRGLVTNLHAPLISTYRIEHLRSDADAFWRRYQPVLEMVACVSQAQVPKPVLVVHADALDSEGTLRFITTALDHLNSKGHMGTIAVELRAAVGPHDDRFDRSLDGLMNALTAVSTDQAGICWDVAHEWESFNRISALDTDVIKWIRHVHIHDSMPDGSVHAPLDVGAIPWKEAVRDLIAHDYDGSITLEIRYRYASEFGEPWEVLRQSMNAIRNELESNAGR